MPELPEVESVRRLFDRTLTNRRLAEVEVLPDTIVLRGREPAEVVEALAGRVVVGTGRKGKFWWLRFAEPPHLVGHLGMSGWVRPVGTETIRLHSHGEAPLDDAEGRPRFLKLLLRAESGEAVAMTDGRRLARLWLTEEPHADPQIAKLGPDSFTELPEAEVLGALLARRRAPLKAVLLDQGLFAGVGNWIADETLYQAALSPKRLANELGSEEVARLRETLRRILAHAVEVDADYTRFPPDWLFHHRWGGGRGVAEISGQAIVREAIGGRTTAWVPQLQR